LISRAAAPKNYDDYLRPQFKGQIAVNRSTPYPVTGMISLLGEEQGLAYFKKFSQQEPRLIEGYSHNVNLLTAGEFVLRAKHAGAAFRLAGADVSHWPRSSFGRFVGYLPQDVELFADTVASNISRFRNDDDQEVIEAAQMAGVHDMILRLPGGYETQIGEGGTVLSGGYRQRIGLARAVYDNPSLVVLDEPSSNLDSDGDAALLSCIAELKKRGTTVVMISHRPNTLGAVDKLLLLREGVDDRTVAARLGRRGVATLALSNSYAGPNRRHGLLLGFGCAEPERLFEATRILGEVLGETA
jgi:ABC-type lipoprotein export system ATPase subunit